MGNPIPSCSFLTKKVVHPPSCPKITLQPCVCDQDARANVLLSLAMRFCVEPDDSRPDLSDKLTRGKARLFEGKRAAGRRRLGCSALSPGFYGCGARGPSFLRNVVRQLRRKRCCCEKSTPINRVAAHSSNTLTLQLETSSI